MSVDEVRDFCQTILPYRLKVQVRLKTDGESYIGMITRIDPERFELSTEDKGTQLLRFAWVARVKNA